MKSSWHIKLVKLMKERGGWGKGRVNGEDRMSHEENEMCITAAHVHKRSYLINFSIIYQPLNPHPNPNPRSGCVMTL